MHSSYDESQSSNEFSQNQYLRQQSLFQKYSNLSANNQSHHQEYDYTQQRNDQQYESDNFPDVEQDITPIAQTKVVDSNIQVVSEDEQHHQQHERSLIESVPKDNSENELQFVSDSHHDLSNVPEASSKIIHQAASRHQVPQYVQNYPQPQVNSSAVMHPQRVINQTITYQQQNIQQTSQHQQNLRHTIGNNVSPRQMIDPKSQPQQIVMRGSLPPNMNAHQLMMNQAAIQQNYGQIHNGNQQIVNQRQFATISSSPQVRPQQFVSPPQSVNAVQGIHVQHFQHHQQVRMPHHLPQEIIPIKSINSETLVETVNFIKNGPQKLETSEIVYKNRNPIVSNQAQSQPQVQVHAQNGFTNGHQQNQHQNTQMIQRGSDQVIERGGSQGQRGVSGDAVRSHTRSLERRSTNVTFNYNVQQLIQQPQRVNHHQIQQIVHLPPQQHHSRSTSLSPVQVQLPQQPVLQNPQIQPASTQVIQQRQPALSTITQVQVRNEWKERYFGLYEQFQTVNKKVEYVNESFYIYEKLIQVSKQEKIIKKHTKIMNTIQELQQECASIVHEWKPTSEFKKLPNQKVETQKIQKDKDSGHLETKYKRLLFNYSKIQEENESFKKNFEDKIHQVVKKLENENSTLSQTIKKLKSENKSLSSEILSLKQSLTQAQQQRQLQVPVVQQSDDLTLSESLKLELEESIARYHQQNRVLQDELERVSEELESEKTRNEQLIETVRMIEEQMHEQKVRHERETTEVMNSQEKRIGIENIENIIEELNIKILEYQQKLTTIQDEIQRLNYVNHQVQTENGQLKAHVQELEQQCSVLSQNSHAQNNSQSSHYQQLKEQLKNKHQQLMNAVSDVETFEVNNYMLTEEVQKLNQKIVDLESQLENAKSTYHQTNSSHTTVVTNNQDRINVERLEVQNSKLYQQNVSLRDELQRVNSELRTLNGRFTSVSYELQTSTQRGNKLQQELNESQMNLSEYNIKISNFEREIKHLQEVIHSKSQSVSEPVNPSPILIQQYEFTISTLRAEVNRKESQIERQSRLSDQRILDLTEQLKLAYKEREALHKKYEEKTLLLEGERQKKEILIRDLRDKIYELEQRKRLEQVEESRSREYISKISNITETKELTKLSQELDSLRNLKQKQSRDHTALTNQLREEIHQLSQDNSRLKKQISDFSHTINQLEQVSQTLSKKNMEILELKNIAFENQKLVIQVGNLRREVERHYQEGLRVQTQNQKLQKNIFELNKVLKEYQNNLHSVNARLSSLQNQYKQSQQILIAKDLELNKIRLAIQSLEQEHSSTLKEQEKLVQKLKNLEVAHEQQSLALKDLHQSLKAKQQEIDQMNRQKITSEHKITELESYKQKYEYQLKENQELITKLKSKLKVLESEKQDLQQEAETFKEKFAQVEKKAQQQTKKYKKLYEELQEKNKHLQEKQIKYEKEKIHELQTQVKTKENKIWKLQKELEEVLERLDEVGDQEISGQKVMFLEQKIKDYEARLFTQAFRFTPTNFDYEATKVFEQKVIYELKQENEKLKEYISQKRIVKPTNDKGNHPLELSKAEIQIKEAYDEELDEVQGRLNAFNQKLESLINNGTYENTASGVNENLKKTRKSPSKLSGLNLISQKQVETGEGPRQLKELRVKYAELERYCKNIEVQLLSNKSQKTITSNNFISVSSNSIAHNEVTFLKDKNKELDERVEKLLKMNTQLKENLEQLLQQRNEHSSGGYYKDQVTELNQKVLTLEQRVKKLLEENQRLKGQLGSYSKNEESGQVKTFELERKLVEMQRQINELLHIKSALESDLHTQNQHLQSKIYEIAELRKQLSSSSEKESSVVLSLRQKLQTTENDVIKLTNKLRINESEIERLNEVIKKKQSESVEEINRWRVKVSQLQEELNRIGEEKEGERTGQANLKVEISRLNQEIKSLNYYNQEVKQNNENLVKRLQECESRLRQLNSEYEELQNTLAFQRSQEQQWIMKHEQQEAQSAKLSNQILILRQEIERLGEDSKLKQRNYEIELHSLIQKLTLGERELLSFKKNTSVFESDRQIMDNEIARLKNYISQLTQQLQDKDQTHRSKYFLTQVFREQMYEDKIGQLKIQITQIESHSTSSQHTISDLNLHRERVESQLVEQKNQITILKSEIQRLSGVLREREASIHSLNLNGNSLKEQQGKYEHEISRLTNQVNVLKEEIERLNFVIVEKDSMNLSLRSKNEAILLEKENFERELAQRLMEIKGLREENEGVSKRINELEFSSSSQVKELRNELQRVRREVEESRVIIKTLQIERENDQREVGKWISEYNLLRQENLSLINKISQLEANYQLAIKISPAEFEGLKEQNQQLKDVIRVLEEKLGLVKGLGYLVELSRSIILEIEVLLDQKMVSNGEEVEEINYRIDEDIGRGLDTVAKMWETLNYLA